MAEQKSSLCDLVLEGGVTSGVLYLGAIAELSRHYRFKNLGGTSSGAISAAAAAIAQRSRLTLLSTPAHERKFHPDLPFDKLFEFPDELAKQNCPKGRTALFQLFQPQASTRRGYRIVAAVLDRWAIDKPIRAAAQGIKQTVVQFPLVALLGAIPGLWLLDFPARSLLQSCDPARIAQTCASPAIGATLALGLALGGGVLAAIVVAVYTTVDALKRNHFGFCNGMHGLDSPRNEPLTVTMHRLFNQLLNLKPEDEPVTFAHVWWGKKLELEGFIPSVVAGMEPAEREIDLQVIVSAVNLRRPFRLPNDPKTDPLREFFYDPQEWKDFFPSVVMDWLKKFDRLQGKSGVVSRDTGAPLAALPTPALWPVIVPVRMSCAFPGLLSAVPMYYIDAKPHADHPEVEDGQDEDASKVARGDRFVATKVYFCDGGITSNCPVELFDSALPDHPTFAIALDNLSSAKVPCHRVHVPSHTDLPKPSVIKAKSTWSFASAILRTGIDWHDGLQRALPGYRERVATVGLKPKEGGLNLAMAPETIRNLRSLGVEAGRKLLEKFPATRAGARGNGWEQHRWLRLRTTLAAAQSYLSALHVRQCRSAAERADGAEPWVINEREMLDLEPPPEPIFADSNAIRQAKSLLQGLSELAESTSESRRSTLSDNAPQPTPKLRMSPPW